MATGAVPITVFRPPPVQEEKEKPVIQPLFYLVYMERRRLEQEARSRSGTGQFEAETKPDDTEFDDGPEWYDELEGQCHCVVCLKTASANDKDMPHLKTVYEFTDENTDTEMYSEDETSGVDTGTGWDADDEATNDQGEI